MFTSFMIHRGTIIVNVVALILDSVMLNETSDFSRDYPFDIRGLYDLSSKHLHARACVCGTARRPVRLRYAFLRREPWTGRRRGDVTVYT